jgi:hypothetical protein
MHDDRSGEIVEFFTIGRLQPGLNAVRLIPGDAFEKGIDEADDQKGCRELWIEARAFGNAAGYDGGNRRRESEQEEEARQFKAILLQQGLGAGEEVDAVGKTVADEEIGDRRYREIGQDLHQRVDLALLAYGAEFEKGKAGMHRQHHDAAKQNEQNVGTRLECFHDSS